MAVVDPSDEEVAAGIKDFNNKHKTTATLNSVSRYTRVSEDTLLKWGAARFFAKVAYMGDEAALNRRIQENYKK